VVKKGKRGTVTFSRSEAVGRGFSHFVLPNNGLVNFKRLGRGKKESYNRGGGGP